MEIHELNTFSGTLGSGDFFATDNGNDTSKVSAEAMFAPLNNRIDNIIAGPASSAEEVIDARLGATSLGGTQYPSLGEAIRGQATLLDLMINGIENETGIVTEKATANSRWPYVTLDVEEGKPYTIKLLSMNGATGYDNIYVSQGSTTVVSGVQDGKPHLFTAPSGGSVRLTMRFASAPSTPPTVTYELIDVSEKTINESNKATICNGDFNDIPNNSIYGVDGGASLLNAPWSSSFTTIITYGKFATRSAGDFQIAVKARDNILAFRTYYNATVGWSDWQMQAYTLQGLNITITNDNKSVICNGTYDDIPNNRIYGVGGDAVLDNAPWDSGFTTLITFGKFPDRTAGDFQIAVRAIDNTFTYRTYYNASRGWSAWKQETDSFVIDSFYSGIEMFERFGVIGDSFASGDIVTSHGQYEVYELSWGQMLARMSGSTGVNYSRGGYGTYKFVDPSDPQYNNYCLGKLLSDIQNSNACGLYLCCLGINDSNSQRVFGDKNGGLEYLGTSADVNLSDPTQNANSFWGNYGRIIQTIQSESPNSKIVMCTFCRNNSGTQYAYDEYIEAIQEIAEFFGLPCITLTDDKFFNSSFYINHLVSNHPTAPQYVGYAKAIERLLSRAIVGNYDYFKEYIGV